MMPHTDNRTHLTVTADALLAGCRDIVAAYLAGIGDEHELLARLAGTFTRLDHAVSDGDIPRPWRPF